MAAPTEEERETLMNDSKTLSVLIPVYNEQEYLLQVIQRVLTAPVSVNLRKELVIVNDASKYGTTEYYKSSPKRTAKSEFSINQKTWARVPRSVGRFKR